MNAKFAALGSPTQKKICSNEGTKERVPWCFREMVALIYAAVPTYKYVRSNFSRRNLKYSGEIYNSDFFYELFD
jgi:hypothetical protein